MDHMSIPRPSTKDPKDWREYLKKCHLLYNKMNGYRDVRATPLVEVFSVSIQGIQTQLYDDGEPCQIYGTIRVRDVEGTCFELYNREMNEPETMYIGGSLSLTGLKDGAIFPCGSLEVKIHLKDKARGVEVTNDVLLLDYNSREYYDNVITKYAHGKHGSVAICYTRYQSAVIANVQITYVNKEDINIYGSVRACCVSGHGYPYNDFEEKKKEYASSVLFERPRNQLTRVNTRTPLALSRSIVAVPADSCVIIEVNLSSCDAHAKPISGTLKFLACDYANSMNEVVDDNGDDIVRVVVLWSHAHLQRLHASSKQREDIKIKEQLKSPRCFLGINLDWNIH